jgi:hypothetical protein
MRGLNKAALAVAMFAVPAAASNMAGCGASAQTIAAYSAEHARCQLNQRAIVERRGTTEEEDMAAWDAEVARCDAALRAIEEAD